MKKFLALSIALVLMVSSGSMVLAQANDYETSWAKDEISYMMEKGIVKGYPDGTFKPKENMKKSQFYNVINGLIGFTEKAEVDFSEFDSKPWYSEDIEKGVKAGYILANATLDAESLITRAEVARIIGFVFEIEENEEAAKAFTDHANMPESLKGIIGGLRANGFIQGYPDGRFGSTENISRAEVVTMLYNVAGQVVNEEAVVNEDAAKNLIVSASDVELKDMTIEGNLYLTEGIGEGDVTLDNVTVKGFLSIKGGGANSIKINNSKINTILVNKAEGSNVRVVLENTTVNEVKTSNDVKLELTKETAVKEMKLDGKIELVAEKGTSIDEIDATSKEVTIKSEGNIKAIKTTQDIKVNDLAMKAGSEAKVAEGKSTQTKAAPTTAKPVETGSAGSAGSGGGGGSSTTPTPTPTPSEYDRIISKYRSELVRLQTDIISELEKLAREAYSKKDTASATDIQSYKDEVERLNGFTDIKFNNIISRLESELELKGYNSTSEVNRLTIQYDTTKSNLKAVYDQQIKDAKSNK